MAEPGVADAWFRRLNVAVTVIVCAAVAGIAYRYERAYRRWSDQNRPLAVPRARLERMRTNYRDRRDLVTEMAQVAKAMRESGQYRRSMGS
jgi:hypothetical protein